MRKLFSGLLVCILFFAGTCLAHSGAEHVAQYKVIFNGFGASPDFAALVDYVNKAVDTDMPEAFRAQGLKVPGNHRILGHAHAFNAPIPRETLNELLAANPGKKEEIIKVISETNKRLTRLAQLHTGLPKAQASALVSIIHNIHLLGDYEPSNRLVSYVLKPQDAAKNIIRECEVLFKNDPKLVDTIRQNIKSILNATAKADPQVAASKILSCIASLNLGERLHTSWGNTLKMKFSPLAAQRAADARIKMMAKSQLYCNENQIKERRYPLKKEMFNKVTGGTIMKPALLTADGRLLIQLKAASKAAGSAAFVVVAFEAGVATYQYVTGSISSSDFEEQLAEAAIKGAAVGTCTAVAVVLGANPVGLVVVAVGWAAYEITDMAIEATRKSYISEADLKAFGAELDSVLSIPDDSVFNVKFDTPFKLPVDTPLSIEHDTPFELL